MKKNKEEKTVLPFFVNMTNEEKEIVLPLYLSVKTLLEILKKEGVEQKMFDRTEMDLDYTDCYYESDAPRIKIIIR